MHPRRSTGRTPRRTGGSPGLRTCAIPLIACAVLQGCKRPDLTIGCLPAPARQAPQPIQHYQVYVDASRSMAHFVAPAARRSVPPYAELLARLFSTTAGNRGEYWMFGGSLDSLGANGGALEDRGSYTQGASQLQLAFKPATTLLDAAIAPYPGQRTAARPSPKPPRRMVILVTDGLQDGPGAKLEQMADLGEMIEHHLAAGGSFAFVAGMADTFGERDTTASGTAPVFAFVFADGDAVDQVRELAETLAGALRPAPRGGGTHGRSFVLPAAMGAPALLAPRTGVAALVSPSVNGRTDISGLTVKPDGSDMEITASLPLDPLTRENQPDTIPVEVDRCMGRQWVPLAASSAEWTAIARKSAADGRLLATLRRPAATARGSGFYRVRIEGQAVPAWVAAEFGAGRTGTETDLNRFFEGVRKQAQGAASALSTIYVLVEGD